MKKAKTPKTPKVKTWIVEKPEGYKVFSGSPRKIGFWKGLGATVFGVSISAILLGAGAFFYQQQVLYPSELIVKEELTGRYALKKYEGYLSSYDTENLQSFTGSPYLANEVKLQNKNEFREKFIKTVLGTVKYKALTVDALNKYGTTYYKPGTNGETKQDTSLVNFGEQVDFTYIDYSKLDFNPKVVNLLMENAKIKQTDDNFVEEITNLFAQYIAETGKHNLPTKTVKRSPKLIKGNDGFTVDSSEDVYLDQLLFSSQEFKDALDRFSLVAMQGTEVESKEHQEWASKPEEERAKYIFPDGDGSKENPAGINTPITTVVLTKNDKGEDVKTPIRVTLLKVTYGSDAIKDIMKANIRNRGIDPKSDNKYIYTEWKVENLSSGKVTFEANSALADSEGNVSARTGVMYGLKDLAELDAYQFVNLQDWYASTELKEKYLIWGKNFKKVVKPVWFQALKGSHGEVKIPDDPIQTDDVSSVKNNEGTDKE